MDAREEGEIDKAKETFKTAGDVKDAVAKAGMPETVTSPKEMERSCRPYPFPSG